MADRLYRFLLHAYPAEFRDEYGPQLAQMFRDRRREAGPLATWTLAIVDLLKTAPMEHLDVLLRDLRGAFRFVRNNPGFAAVAVLCLALGLGANTAIFSLLNATLFNELPAPEPQRLVSIARGGPGDRPPFSYLDFEDLRARATSFSGLFLYSDLFTFKLGSRGRLEEAGCEMVSMNYFDTLEIGAAMGRTFTPADSDQPVIVLSNGLWRSRFASDPAILGHAMRVNGVDFTVIGVAPASFHGVLIPWNTAAWIPIKLMPRLLPRDAGTLADRFADCCGVAGRLNPGVSRRQAEAEIRTIGTQLASAYPRPQPITREPGWDTLSLTSMRGVVPKFVRARLATLTGFMLAVTMLVLLIACANVANMLLARGVERRTEIAVRLAIGARRGRLIRQLLTESAVLTAVAAGATIFLAVSGPRAIASLSPYFIDAHIDARVLAFSVLGALITTVAFGLAPALEASRTDIVATLKEYRGSLRGRWFGLGSALAVAQVAVSFALLAGAGLSLRSLGALASTDPGFDTSRTFFVRLDFSEKHWNAAGRNAFLEDLSERLAHVTGAASVSFASHVPLELPGAETAPLEFGEQHGEVWVDSIAPRYFETLRIPLIAGRAIDDRDRANAAPVAVVSEPLAGRFWHGANPVGRPVRLDGISRTVVGVVAQVKHRFPAEDASPVAYIPIAQSGPHDLRVIVSAIRDPAAVIAPVLAQIQAADSDVAVVQVKTMARQLSDALGPQRGTATLAVLFGVLALMLACLGIYGVVAHSVVERTHEIGIRMALGASRFGVMGMIVGRSFALAAAGTAIGVVLALAVGRLLRGSLYGVGPADPVTFAAVAALWLIVAALAAWLPARRAAGLDPLAALRCQ